VTDDTRASRRDTALRNAVRAAQAPASKLARWAQVLAGFVMVALGVGAIWPAGHRLMKFGEFGVGPIAFFALGALLLLGGLGIAIGQPFWANLGRTAGFADDAWARVRRGRRDGGADG
jgi:hypothetical protein